MIKLLLLRKLPMILGVLWLAYRRKFIVDRLLWILTQRAFIIVGNRYPRLSFLKTAARAPA